VNQSGLGKVRRTHLPINLAAADAKIGGRRGEIFCGLFVFCEGFVNIGSAGVVAIVEREELS
jgi:hypothetical protein